MGPAAGEQLGVGDGQHIVCEKVGANVQDVSRGIGMDNRIGPKFLNAGPGYGGSCFPKDVKALAYMGQIKGRHPQLLHAVMEINADQRRRSEGRDPTGKVPGGQHPAGVEQVIEQVTPHVPTTANTLIQLDIAQTAGIRFM